MPILYRVAAPELQSVTLCDVPTVLAVNPGSTSTKLAVFEGETPIAAHTIRHEVTALSACATLWDQLEPRWQAVLEWTTRNVPAAGAVAAMGGLFRPLAGGIYAVNGRMLEDARANLQGEHASNLGCALAERLALQYGC